MQGSDQAAEAAIRAKACPVCGHKRETDLCHRLCLACEVDTLIRQERRRSSIAGSRPKTGTSTRRLGDE